MFRFIPYIYMILFCFVGTSTGNTGSNDTTESSTSTGNTGSNDTTESSTSTGNTESNAMTELSTSTGNTESNAMTESSTTTATATPTTRTELILVIVGVGCSFMVIVTVVGFVYSEIRSRSKLGKRYHAENGDSTESTKMPDDNEQIIMEEPGNQSFDNYAVIDPRDSHCELIPHEKQPCIDDHIQHDLKPNEDEDHIYAISSKQRCPLKNVTLTPENEKRNQQDSIKEKEGSNGRHVVSSLDEITHVDLNYVKEDGPYAEVSWEQLPSTDKVGDGLVDENGEIGGKNNSRDVSDDDLHDQIVATIVHERDNSGMYDCSKDGDYDSSGTKRLLAASDDEMNTFDH